MAADSQPTHRAGSLKQQNKSHKTGRHRSKGRLQKEVNGRVNAKVLGRKFKGTLNKQDRRNQAQQIRRRKRDEVLAKKRSRGGASSPPFLVAIVSLCSGLDVKAAQDFFKDCDEEAAVGISNLGNIHLSVPRFKQRFSFVCPEYANLYALLDAVKVADSVLFLTSAERGVDAYGEFCLSCLFAQALPSHIIAIQGLKTVATKKQNDAKKMVQKHIEKWFPEEKLQSLDTVQDAILVLRIIGSQKLKRISLREHRSHLMAEDVSFELGSEENECGTLKLSGYIRGQALSANGLVHLPGWGDFQMIQIDAPNDPHPLILKTEKVKQKSSMEVGDAGEEAAEKIRVLEKVDPAHQESLQAEVEVDPMEGEQTWPTEEELAEAEAARQAKKVVKRVPKGTSKYQAAWILDSEDEEDPDKEDDEDDEDDDDAEDDNMDQEDEVEEAASQGDEDEGSIDDEEEDEEDEDEEDEEYETMPLEEDADKYDAAIDVDEEGRMLAKLKEERLNQMFPDETDTPGDVPAATRFQKYRGLKSFRTSPWDPKENLPQDYSRIFQFENFARSKARVLAGEREVGALPGWYVTVHIANVPKDFMAAYRPGHPVIVYGLLPHEQKMSVVHFRVKRHADGYSLPIKSKEPVVFHVGYRRFSACPVYSQHTNGDKHKFERFLPTDTVTIATVYAPITFPPAAVLMFKETASAIDRDDEHPAAAPEQELVATGSLHSVTPDRVITKRIVLSGHPFKINKKMAVIRYMFFNRDDILWFKPIELRTKWGRRGHIREPLGTHGHMKCVFDKQLRSQDTILMNLYKRIFPKWTYNPRVLPPGASTLQPRVMQDLGQALFDD